MKKIIILLISALIIGGCTKEKDPAQTPYVKYEKVKYAAVKEMSEYSGYIESGGDIELSFNLSGMINGFYAAEGDYVKKGALLAKLDTKEYDLNLSKSEFELNDAIVKYKRAKSYYERISKLYKAGGISYNDWEGAQTDLKSAKNQIEIIKDSQKIAKEKKDYTKLHAPKNGYIIKTLKDNLEYINAGETVILFQDEGYTDARIFVPQNKINLINKNDAVIIRTDAIKNKSYKGFVRKKVNSSINSGSYKVTVRIENKANELLDGMSVKAILKEKEKTGIFIPVECVIKENDKNYVYILENLEQNKGTARKREVQTGGIYERDKIEIKCGIKENELIITEGTIKLMDNIEVFIKND